MNSAVITKIEYKFPGEEQWSVLSIIPESAKLKEDQQKTGAGTIYTTVVDASVAKIDSGNNLLIKSINNRKAQFRVTDANGTIYLVGNDLFKARLTHQSALDGTPGSFGGYRVSIKLQSPNGCEVQ